MRDLSAFLEQVDPVSSVRARQTGRDFAQACSHLDQLRESVKLGGPSTIAPPEVSPLLPPPRGGVSSTQSLFAGGTPVAAASPLGPEQTDPDLDALVRTPRDLDAFLICSC